MSLRTLKLVLAIVIVGFIVSAAYIAVLIVERQDVLKHVARYNTPWHAAQAVHEFTRLEQRLSAYAAPEINVTKDEALHQGWHQPLDDTDEHIIEESYAKGAGAVTPPAAVKR